MTPNSNATSLLSASEFLNRVDVQLVGNLVSQDPNGRTVPAASLPTNAVLLATLDDASGLLEAATLQGERYSPSDLAALTGVSQKFMYRLLTDLTMGLLLEIKVDKSDSPGLQRRFDRAMQILEKLSQGELIFAFTETADVGHAQVHDMTASDIANLKLPTWIARRYFGRRANIIGACCVNNPCCGD